MGVTGRTTGSGLHERIWKTVRRIPKGRVATYGQIARVAGLRSHARLVGYALHSLPPGFPVPWHRVINAKGRISLPERNRHRQLQRKLLEAEGIRFKRDRIDLEEFGWEA
jgi:methylated-DNA-protein-cysteine methyltransferase-like protein